MPVLFGAVEHRGLHAAHIADERTREQIRSFASAVIGPSPTTIATPAVPRARPAALRQENGSPSQMAQQMAPNQGVALLSIAM